MRRKMLVPLAIVLAILGIPAWAEKIPDAAILPVNPALLSVPAPAPSTVSPGLRARARPLTTPAFTESFFDTVPLFSLGVPALKSVVHVELALEENVVGLRTVDGVGLMLDL